MLRLLLTLSKDGTVQVWKTRVIINPNRPPMQANFFEPAGELLFFPLLLFTLQLFCVRFLTDFASKKRIEATPTPLEHFGLIWLYLAFFLQG